MIKLISLGGFTNKETYKKMPFWILKENKSVLISHRNMLVFMLETRSGTDKFNGLFLKAFDYFIENPKEYDGTSGGEELDVITYNGIRYRYDIASMVHDYLDVCGFTVGLTEMKASDKLLVLMTESIHNCSFNIGKRKAVAVMARYRVWKNRRRENYFYDIKMHSEVLSLVEDYKVNYIPVIKYSAYAVLLLVALISKYGFKYIVNIFLSLF